MLKLGPPPVGQERCFSAGRFGARHVDLRRGNRPFEFPSRNVCQNQDKITTHLNVFHDLALFEKLPNS